METVQVIPLRRTLVYFL